MIKSEKGTVKLVGPAALQFFDLVFLLRSIYSFVKDESDADTADAFLTLAGKYALMDEKEMREKIEEAIKELMK